MSIVTRSSIQAAVQGDFLPNLCALEAVFRLVILGELLALALVLADQGIKDFDLAAFGLMSLMVQWVVLVSAAGLCRLAPWFRKLKPWQSTLLAYVWILTISTSIGLAALRMQAESWSSLWPSLGTQILITMVIAGVALRYFYVQQQLQEQTKAELRARIQALQSRIRPHFLFNSMNSIASLITIDPERAEAMVEDLSDLFRASLSEPGLVPLSKELDLCRRFVRIEQTRIGERLSMVWEIDPAVLDVKIPSLLLQPLIENAIYHGIQPLREGGEVKVSARLVADQCWLEVSNPLPDPSTLNTKGNGLALENIHRRLSAYFEGKTGWQTQIDQGRYLLCVQFPAKIAETT
ncbi:MAG TPA: sensor histidine kinase [Cellvibrionaceae bacterium]